MIEGTGQGRLIAVGDVHGCLPALRAVCSALQPQPEDTVVMLGDYVDRGADSRGVIDFLRSLTDSCHLVSLRGNHEELMLAACQSPTPALLDAWKQCGGLATLESYGGAVRDIPADHLEWIDSCRLYYETEEHIFVHANYVPQLPMERQDSWHLLWPHLSPVPAPHCSGKRVIVGHTPQPTGQVLDAGHIVCVDTYCFGSGCLTALDVDSGEIWRADKEGVRWT